MNRPRFLSKATQTARIGLRPGGIWNTCTQAKYGHLAGAWVTAPMGPGFPEGAGCKQPDLCLHPTSS